jgi:hypothetical protein
MGYAQAGPFVYLVGGQDVTDAEGNVNATQRYDILANEWTDGPEFTSARGDLSVGVTDHFIYAIGGDAASGFFWDPTNDVEKLDWTTWPDGAWETVDDEPPVANASMRTNFCTSGISTSEIWSIAGTQGDASSPGILQDATQFRPNINEKCFAFFSDVPWLSENPPAGTVDGDSVLDGSIVLDSEGLDLGTYEATIFMRTTDPRAGSLLIPVTMNVVEPVLSVSLSGSPLAKSGDPGTEVSYSLTVTNTGNTTDAYDIVLASGRNAMDDRGSRLGRAFEPRCEPGNHRTRHRFRRMRSTRRRMRSRCLRRLKRTAASRCRSSSPPRPIESFE